MDSKVDCTTYNPIGRETEIESLNDAYDGSVRSCNIVWVTGSSCVGKSALVEYVFRTKPYFCAEKFDRLQSTEPFSALANILSKLRRILNFENPISQCSTDKGEAPLFMVSEVNKNSDTRQENDDHTGIATSSFNESRCKQRLVKAIRGLVATACTVLESPLVIFLDDLQCADDDSIDIIHELVGGIGMVGLLFIGSYRDNEVNDSDALSRCIRETFNFTSQLTIEIKVTNIDEITLNNLVADLLHEAPSNIKKLSEIIHRKTNGNYFFALQMLCHIIEQKMLYFCDAEGRWKWSYNIQDKVAVCDTTAGEFMMKKLSILPTATTNALSLAACLGTSCSIDMVDALLNLVVDLFWFKDKMSLREALDVAIKEGLIEMSPTQTRIKFSHDRVAEAAYELLPCGKKRNELHLSIGRYLQGTLRPNETHGPLFLLCVDQLNRGSNLIIDERERIELARMNLLGGRQVVKSSAFHLAASFLESGIHLLGIERWKNQYELTLQLSNTFASVLFSNGKMDESIRLVEEIYANTTSVSEHQHEAQHIQLEILASTNRLTACLDVGLQIVQDIGRWRLPRKTNCTQISHTICAVQKMIKGLTDDDLLMLPLCNDKSQVHIMRHLSFLIPTAQFANELCLIPILACQAMKLALRYGVNEYIALVFAQYGSVLRSAGDMDGAYRFGRLTLQMMRRFHEDPRALVVVHSTLLQSRKPIHESVNPTLRAYQLTFLRGDLQYAGIACTMHLCIRYAAGLSLEHITRDGFAFCQQLKKYKQYPMLNWLLALQHTLYELIGHSKEMRVFGTSFDSDNDFASYLGQWEEISKITIFTFRVFAMQCRFYLGDMDSALDYGEKCWRSKDRLAETNPFVNGYYLISAHTALDFWKKTSKMRYWRVFRKYHEKIKMFAKQGNVNTTHLVLLLNTELLDARTRKPSEKTTSAIREGYKQSIAIAARTGFLHDAALFHERAGQFHLRLNKTDRYWARYHFTNAWDRYKDWGATAKTHQMENMYGEGLLERTEENLVSTTRGTAVESSKRYSIVCKGQTSLHVLETLEAARTDRSGSFDGDVDVCHKLSENHTCPLSCSSRAA